MKKVLKNDTNADISDLEKQIEKIIYGLHGLSKEEIKIIEDSFKK